MKYYMCEDVPYLATDNILYYFSSSFNEWRRSMYSIGSMEKERPLSELEVLYYGLEHKWLPSEQ
jgi:hypothetical protein